MLLLALVALGIPLAISLKDRVNAEVKSQARGQADVLAASAAELLPPAKRAALDRLTAISGGALRGRVIVVNRAGRLIADSAGSAELGSSYLSRPEVSAALGGAPYQQDRRSQTLGAEILATAQPILHAGRPIGAVRVTQSVKAVNSAVRTAILGLGLLGAVVLLLGLTASALIARQVTQPIRRLEQAARRVAGGDVEAKVAVEGSREQRSLARSFNEMTDRVSRLVRSQSDFVADASHQLRTPLTALRLRLEELRETDPETDRRAQLDAGMREVDRLSQIVEELLILSRAGEHERPGEAIELDGAAQRALERWSHAAEEQGISLRRVASGDGRRVHCALADLDRALDSLLENAIQYSARGSTVLIQSAPGRIEVVDQGPGLAAGEQGSVFKRFYRGHTGRRGGPGTGLGLPIARELVSQWGGSVTLENRPEGGAVATVSLPDERHG